MTPEMSEDDAWPFPHFVGRLIGGYIYIYIHIYIHTYFIHTYYRERERAMSYRKAKLLETSKPCLNEDQLRGMPSRRKSNGSNSGWRRIIAVMAFANHLQAYRISRGCCVAKEKWRAGLSRVDMKPRGSLDLFLPGLCVVG